MLDYIFDTLGDMLEEAKDIPAENLAIIASALIGVTAIIFKNSDSE